MIVKFNEKSLFSLELKKEVEDYFKQNNISKKGNWNLYTKTILLILTSLLSYVVLVCFTPSSNLISLFLCGMFGINLACIGFNVMHDAAHGSYSENKKVNTILAHTLEVMGASLDIWKRKHNINHHTNTNTDHDDDINTSPFLRLHHGQKWHWWYSFQVLYMWGLYALEYLAWITLFDIKKYFTGNVTSTSIKMNARQKRFFWGSKLVYWIFFMIIPIYFVGVTETIVGYLIMAGVCGITISIVFQLAHVQEKSSFPLTTKTEKEDVVKIEKDLYLHQIETTANFATQNPLISWFLGGLNFQIEHHLFPNISHVHYPALQKIVKRVCQKHKIHYLEFTTFIGALRSHVTHILKLSF